MKKVSLVLGILTVLLFASSAKATVDNWADANYSERVSIPITNTGEFQPEIILNSSILNAQSIPIVTLMQPNGCDLKFYANDNITRLKHYLEYDTINISGNSLVRVDVASQSMIWLYYKNSSAVPCYSNPESISPAGIGDNFSTSAVNTSKLTDIPAWGTRWGQENGELILNATTASSSAVYSNEQLQSPNMTVKWAFNVTISGIAAWEMIIRGNDGTYSTGYAIREDQNSPFGLHLMKLQSYWQDLGTINATASTSQSGTMYIKQIGNDLTACVNSTTTQSCISATDSTYTSGGTVTMYKYIVVSDADVLKVDWFYAVNESDILSYKFGTPEQIPSWKNRRGITLNETMNKVNEPVRMNFTGLTFSDIKEIAIFDNNGIEVPQVNIISYQNGTGNAWADIKFIVNYNTSESSHNYWIYYNFPSAPAKNFTTKIFFDNFTYNNSNDWFIYELTCPAGSPCNTTTPLNSTTYAGIDNGMAWMISRANYPSGYFINLLVDTGESDGYMTATSINSSSDTPSVVGRGHYDDSVTMEYSLHHDDANSLLALYKYRNYLGAGGDALLGLIAGSYSNSEKMGFSIFSSNLSAYVNGIYYMSATDTQNTYGGWWGMHGTWYTGTVVWFDNFCYIYYPNNESFYCTTYDSSIIATEGAEQSLPTSLVVNLHSPQHNNITNATTTTINFNCSASSNSNLIDISLYGNWGSWHANETQNVSGNFSYAIFSKILSQGTYIWNCQACDDSGCAFADGNYTFTIVPHQTPSINILSPNGFYDNWNNIDRTFNNTWFEPFSLTNNTNLYNIVYSINNGTNISTTIGSLISLDVMKNNITICGQNIIGEWGCGSTSFEVNGDVGEPKILFNYTMPVDRGLIYVNTMNSFDWDGDGANEVAIGTSGNDASVWVLDNCSSPSCPQSYLPPRLVGYAKTIGVGTQTDRWIWKIQTGDMGGNDGVLNELCVGTGGVDPTYIRCYKWNGTWYEENYTYANSLVDFETIQFCNVNNSTKPQLFGSNYNQVGGGQMVIVQNYTDTSPLLLGTCRPSSAMSCQDIDSDGINETVFACEGNSAPSMGYIDWNGSAYSVKNIYNDLCQHNGYFDMTPVFQGDDQTKCDYDGDGDQDVMIFCTSGFSNYTRFNATNLIDTHETLPLIINWGGKIADNRYPNECSVATSYGNRSIYRNVSSNEVIFKGRPTEGSMQWIFNTWTDVDNDGYSEMGYAQYSGSQGNRTIMLLDFSPLLLLPVITIYSPQNIIYNTTSIDLQVSANMAIDTWWYKLNGGTNTTFTPNTTITGTEGNNSLIVYGNDSTGNIGFETVDFTVDSIAPTITIISPTVSSYNTTSIPLEVSANETIDTWWFDLNGAGNTTFTPNITLPTPLQGSNLITVYANDSSGNIGSSQVYFFVDSISPSVTITSPQNINYNTTSIALQVSADEIISSWKYKLNGGINTTFSPNTTITAIQGSNNIIVYAVDTIGNIGSSTISFFVDSISPNIIVTSPQNISYTTTSIGLNVMANEAIDTWVYSLNGGANTTFTPNITVTASQGNNDIRVWANDSYGNLNTSVVYFFVDSIPPIITIYSPQNITYNGVSQTDLNASANEPVDSWWYSINGGSNSTFTPNSTINMANGSNTLIVYCNDTAGNIGTASISFTANYPTVTTLISPNNGNSTISSVPINMTFICSAINDINLANISLYFGSNSIAWHLNETRSVTGISNSSTFIKTLPIGNYTWSCYSCDYADQCSWAVPNWTISITAPAPVHFGLIYNLGQFGFLAGIAIGAGILMFLIDIFFGSMAEALKNPKKLIVLIIGVIIMVAIFSVLF